MKKWLWILICLTGLYASSQAVLYRYEPFDYTPNTGLRVNTALYTVSGGDPFATNRADSLTYEALVPSVGGKVQSPGHRGATGFAGTINSIWTTNLVPATQPVFASLLLNVTAVGTLQSNSYIFALRNAYAALAITNHPGGKYKIGLSQGTGVHPVWTDNGGAGYDTGTTYFVVISYTNTGGVATNMGSQLWVNPATGLTEPPGSEIAMVGRYNTNALFTMNFGNGNGSQTGPSTIYVDEIRIGSTWVDVTPSGVKAYPVLTDADVLPSRTNTLYTGNTQDVFVAVKNKNGAPASNVTVRITSLPAGFSANNATNTDYGTVATDQTKTNTTAIQVVAPLSGVTFGTPYSFSFEISGISSNVTYTTNGNFEVILQQAVDVTGQSANNKFFLAADVNEVATNALMTVSNSSDSALVCTLTESAPWLTLPGGSNLVVAPHSASNVIMTAGPLPSRGQNTAPLTVAYNHTVTNFQNFTVQFDVGPKVDPLVDDRTTAETGGVNLLNGLYEPGEIIQITIPSTNNGAIPVTNIVHTLWANPAYFKITNNAGNYAAMAIGSATSTTYQVLIDPGTPHGNYTFYATNSGHGSSWSGSFTLPVYNLAVPGVSTGLTINVPAGGTTNGIIVLTNAGNKAVGFNLTDNGSWLFSYAVQTQTATMAVFSPIPALGPNTNNTFVSWSGSSTAPINIGFDFPFYGTVYTTLSASRYGAVEFGTSVGGNTGLPPVLPFGNSPLIAPFWGNTLAGTNSMRFSRQSDKLVLAWGNRTGHEFQTWLYPNGQIRYLYEQTVWSDGVLGVQKNTNSYQMIDYTPGNASQSILLTPVGYPWVTPSATNGNLGALSVQTITYTANASGQTNGTTNSYNVSVIWDNGITSSVPVTVIVNASSPSMGAPTDITFAGPAGAITKTTMGITNTGDIPLNFSITDTNSQGSGYTWTNVTFNWDSSGYNLNSGEAAIFNDGDDKTAWMPIGFDFPFYGNMYNQFKIDTDGGVVFTPAYDRFIATFTTALTIDANTTIRYARTSNKLIVTWRNIYQSSDGSDQTFQMVMYKNGNILLQYQSLTGSAWPNAFIGLHDTTNRISPATLSNQLTTIIVTNYITTTSMPYNLPVVTTNATNVVVTYKNTVTEQAVLFTPASARVLSVDPVSGTLPVGGTQTITITGDARTLTPGGASLVITSTVFQITSEAASKNVTVNFGATNSVETSYDRTAMWGAEPVFTSQQNPDGTRTISWEAADDSLSRTYTVWYTTDLMSGWIELYRGDDFTSYVDSDPVRAALPVIYYKVTVQ